MRTAVVIVLLLNMSLSRLHAIDSVKRHPHLFLDNRLRNLDLVRHSQPYIRTILPVSHGVNRRGEASFGLT